MFEASQTNQDAAPAVAGDGQSEVSTQDRSTAQDTDDSFFSSDSPDQDEQTEELAELEVDGKKFQLSKAAVEKLQAERMMHADYTQKTQTAAAERQQLATQREQFTQYQQQHQVYLADYAKVVAIDDQLAQFSKLDWSQIIAEDPQYAMQLNHTKEQLQQSRQAAVQAVSQKQQQFALQTQQETAKQVQDANAYLQSAITGFNKERSDQLFNYGVASGIDGNALTQAILRSPAIGVAIHKAELYDALLKKSAPKAAAPAAAAKPVPQVSGSAKVGKDIFDPNISAKEFAERRRKFSQRK